MALYTTIGSRNIPEGGIRLTKSEALEFQKKIIKNWKSFSDIVFLQYGYIASSAVTLASSIYITKIARSLLNIGSKSRFVPYIVSAGMPTILSGLWTEKKVTENTLLMTSGCLMCQQLIFGIGQTILSVIYPTITGIVVHLPIAHNYKTIALPDISYDTRKAFPFCFNLIKSKTLQLQIVAALQIPLIFLLPYLQVKELDKINKILRNETREQMEQNLYVEFEQEL